jgi:hypothetical protein
VFFDRCIRNVICSNVTESRCFEIKRNWERILESRTILLFRGFSMLLKQSQYIPGQALMAPWS